MPRNARDALRTVGRERALRLWGTYGVIPGTTPVYELIAIDPGDGGRVFVYRFDPGPLPARPAVIGRVPH